MPHTPILWSFRRCPFAMRARLAIVSSGIPVHLREILLKDKPDAFLQTSPKGTVPVLDLGADVIAESRDIMLWALNQNDPQCWLVQRKVAEAMIDLNDGAFKQALDHTKYAVRFPDRDPIKDRAAAAEILCDLNARLARNNRYLLADHPTLVDAALRPFVRQFANIDRNWFSAQAWPHLINWLDDFERSESFRVIMTKYPLWSPGDATVHFP